MSDRDVRGLERRWQTTGAAADGAAWLAAALRAGQVERDAVDLAAYVGRPAALAEAREARRGKRARIAAPSPGTSFVVEDVRAWVSGLDRWGQTPLVQAALAASRLASGGGGEAAPLVAAVEAWLACPCAEHRLASIESSRRVRARDADRRRRGARRDFALAACADATLAVMPDAARERAGAAAFRAVEVCGGPPVVRVVQRAVSPLAFPE